MPRPPPRRGRGGSARLPGPAPRHPHRRGIRDRARRWRGSPIARCTIEQGPSPRISAPVFLCLPRRLPGPRLFRGRRRALKIPQASFQLRGARFSGPPGRGFLLEKRLRRSPGGGFFPVREEVPPGRRVVQPKPPPLAQVPNVEPEHLAVHAHPAPRQQRHPCQRPVPAPTQPVPLQRWRQVLAPRIVEKVLLHPQRRIHRPLAPPSSSRVLFEVTSSTKSGPLGSFHSRYESR